MGSLRVGRNWATSLSCIGKGNDNPLLCSCLENPRDGGAWWAVIYGITQSRPLLKWQQQQQHLHICSSRYLFLFTIIYNKMSFPGGTSGNESACQGRRCNCCSWAPWVGKIPWSRKWQLTLVFLPRKFYGQKSLVGYSPWGYKESDTNKLLSTYTHTTK